MPRIAYGFLSHPAKSGHDLYGALLLILGIRQVFNVFAPARWKKTPILIRIMENLRSSYYLIDKNVL